MGEICWGCQEEKDNTIRTDYGDICSQECFDELCDAILGASKKDFNNLLTKD